jgi:hypothetical protein
MAQRTDIIFGNDRTEIVGPLEVRDEVIGTVNITDPQGSHDGIQLNGSSGIANLGGRGQSSKIRLDGLNGRINLGGSGRAGTIHVRDPNGDTGLTVRATNDESEIHVRDPNGDTGLTVRASNDGGELFVRNSNQTPILEVRSAGDGGFVSVNDDANDAHGDLWAVDGDSILRVLAAGGGKIKLDTEDGGEMTIRDTDSDLTAEIKSVQGGLIRLKNKRLKEAIAASAERNGGRLAVNTGSGQESCTVDGSDAALVLTGQPERGVEDREHQRFGGGEVVLRQGADRSDLHVHAQGERDSDYGTDVGNRPRIHLNGPEATLELGRGEQHQQAEAVSGGIVLRDSYDTKLLEMRAENPSYGGGGRHASEVIFWHGNTNGSVKEGGGAIRSHGDGLMFYDARGNEALFITNTGEIHTAKEIREGTL